MKPDELRDYFAGQTVAVLMGNPNLTGLQIPTAAAHELAAEVAYRVADLMLLEREKNKPANHSAAQLTAALARRRDS